MNLNAENFPVLKEHTLSACSAGPSTRTKSPSSFCMRFVWERAPCESEMFARQQHHSKVRTVRILSNQRPEVKSLFLQ